MFSRSIIEDSRSIIEDSRSIIDKFMCGISDCKWRSKLWRHSDNYRGIIYDRNIFIIQAIVVCTKQFYLEIIFLNHILNQIK